MPRKVTAVLLASALPSRPRRQHSPITRTPGTPGTSKDRRAVRVAVRISARTRGGGSRSCSNLGDSVFWTSTQLLTPVQ
jgi:hypothetical protein